MYDHALTANINERTWFYFSRANYCFHEFILCSCRLQTTHTLECLHQI